ncbi:MAG: biopolymer transporter ExbD [Bacteroidales bacterium]|nr:biopolymer transporter ExbD [Bacteroidales bacterium]
MSLSSRNKVSVQFSMSGMTDIVFLLLIFFMLTSTLVVPNALKLLLPQSNQQTAAKPVTTVSITKDIRFYLEKTEIPIADLEKELQRNLRAYRLKYNEDPTISLYADRNVPLEHVVKVMNIARRNNYKLILATSPE